MRDRAERYVRGSIDSSGTSRRPSPVVLRSRRPWPGRSGLSRGRRPAARSGARDGGVPGASQRGSLDERDVAGVAAARDPHPAGVSRPLAAAERPLAALEVPVRAGPEPGAAVGIHPDERALPVVAVEAGIRADAAQQARPEPVRPGQRGVGVGVVEPVLDVEAAAAADDVGEGVVRAAGARGRPATCASSAGSSGATRAAHPAALAPVHRELALARLVHEVGGERAHGRRGRARRTQPRAGPRRGRSGR